MFLRVIDFIKAINIFDKAMNSDRNSKKLLSYEKIDCRESGTSDKDESNIYWRLVIFRWNKTSDNLK